MAFRLEDFTKTSRKSAEGKRAPASVYPHQMRDKKARARLEIAICTFDSLVGKRRGEMDAAAMADFFGDPRLARGVIACLNRWYRYRTPAFSEIIGEERAQHLIANAFHHPTTLRAHLYAHVNAQHDGFLTEAQRAACYTEVAEPLGLAAHELAVLLHLDAEENQVLTRLGAPPTPVEVAALYNFHSLDTPLRRAAKIVLNGLSLSTADAADVRTLARHLGIVAAVSEGGSSVTLSDREMSSLLPRRPGRMSRCLLHLLQVFGSKSLSGYCDSPLGARTYRLALTTEAFVTLGMTLRSSERNGTFRRRFEAAAALHQDLLPLRARGAAAGWRIARRPEPVVTPHGVLLPDFTLSRGAQRVYVVLGEDDTAAEWDAPALFLPLGRKTLTAAAVLARAEEKATTLFSLPERAMPEVPDALRALCDRAAHSGMVAAADAQRALHLLDESPLIEWVQRAADPRVRYLPGIGLCSQALVAAIGAAGAAEGTGN